jgi:hypothetical protein
MWHTFYCVKFIWCPVMDGANYKRTLVRAAPVHMFMILGQRDELILRTSISNSLVVENLMEMPRANTNN